ncbi:hypothetical protein LY90DRAFT_513521 [Neocallimastix californiae]|uniref:Peptidoglycan binding-like domain-containing protein n=1 Tax=Neocallimastix californiae TaxID=1754190 RepID=A0A1Y2AXB9_9FUNG|nr:hypothetical protein LY90DRAFT_513521 [Neocallimastix californiae]|eukprot:ORY27136.1 hypothetical protein LY90DRAFT_513521 [Neocallimastix californiae]
MKLYKITLFIIIFTLLNQVCSYLVERTEFKTLVLTSEGEIVKNCQSRLISLNYFCGSCGADGNFGTNTDKCVRDFQSQNGLAVTGEIDLITYSKLFSDNAIESNYKEMEVYDYTDTASISGFSIDNNKGNIICFLCIGHQEFNNKRRTITNIIKDLPLVVTQIAKAFNINFNFSENEDSIIKNEVSEDTSLLEIKMKKMNSVLCCYFHKSLFHKIMTIENEIQSALVEPGYMACIEFSQNVLSFDTKSNGYCKGEITEN